jgi:hypothetical protein
VNEFSPVPCPLGLPVSETPKRHNASTGSSLGLSGLRVSRFRESGLPSSRLLASRVPGTRNAEMMTHDNMPPDFHDSGNHEASVLPSVLCLSKSRFTKCRTGLAFTLSEFHDSGNHDVRALPFPFRTSGGRNAKWKNAEIPGACSFRISRFTKSGCAGCPCFLEPPVAEKPKWPDALSFGISRFMRNLDTKGIPAPWSLRSPKSRNAQMPKRQMLWFNQWLTKSL